MWPGGGGNVEGFGRMSVALWVGDNLYDPSHMKYIPVAMKFACSDTKNYHGLPIQSYIAQPISNKVVELYSQFLDQHQADIQLKFEEELKKSINIQKTICNIIRDEVLINCVKMVRDHVAELVTQAIQTSVSNQISITATHTTAQHVAAASMLGPAAWAVGGLALYKILALPKTLEKKLGTEIQTILTGNFSQWSSDMLKRAFDDLIDPKKLVKSIGASMLDSVVIPGAYDVFGNQVVVGELKDHMDLIEEIADRARITNPIGLERPLNDCLAVST
ncbi:hypothetical protein G7Y89_g9769 [Cudoniella acicularis]|uniref:Uncharacterized protein n=1 Tax=Cudoniella acicularis TaxID=354080 RepID=A0A8H4RE10_9HELO|nr:hypothetical protein G7Y89_g9769 [Cudoniella acicularis]